MDLKQLPFLPLNYFYHSFTKGQKWIFIALFSVLACAAAGFLFAVNVPWFWAPVVQEAPDVKAANVVAETLRHQYRSMDLALPAFRVWVMYAAGPLLPGRFPSLVFWLMQGLAWAGILGALTLIRTRWIYAGYLLYALFIHFSGIARVLYPEDTFRLLEFALIMTGLGLAYVFQMNMLRWDLLWRCLVFAGYHTLLICAALWRGDWAALDGMASDSMGYLIFLSLIFLLFIAKEPTNLIVVAATHHKEEASRRGLPWVIAGFSLLMLLELFWLLDFLNLGVSFSGLSKGIKPVYLIAVSAIAMVFTSQNQYPQIKGIINSQAAYSLLLLGWGILSLSFWFWGSASGDHIFPFAFERLAVLFFFFVGAGHIFFLLTNHLDLFRQKISLFYLINQGTRFGLILIWLLGMVGIIIAEGSEKWKTIPMLIYSAQVQQADHLMKTGDPAAAISAYENAIAFIPAGRKAHYNLGSLMISDRERGNEGLAHYQEAGRLGLDWGNLNAAAFLTLTSQNESAIGLLGKSLDRKNPNGFIASNLGVLYYRAGMADSAVSAFRLALLSSPDLSSACSNLALLYLESGRKEEARTFFEASIESGQTSEAALTNALYYNLSGNTPALNISKGADISSDYYLTHNYTLAYPDKVADGPLRDQIRTLANEAQSPDPMLLDAWLRLRKDSASLAVSRIDYLAGSFASYKGTARYLLGAWFYKAGAPEMARQQFLMAGEAGNTNALLDAARMRIEMGQKDSAAADFSLLRARHPELREGCARELAMLLNAYGQGVFAQTEWDLGKLSDEERIRMGCYADSLNRFINALEIYRDAIGRDSASVLPYLEMGRIYNRYRDPLARQTLEAGLKIDSSFQPLRLQYARALLYQGLAAEAAAVKIPSSEDKAFEAERYSWLAEQALTARDTALAVAHLDTLLQLRPLDSETQVRLVELLLAHNETDAANTQVLQALAINTENEMLWYYYAWISRKWSLTRDAGFGATKAIGLAASEARKKEIAAEFATEIREIALNNQSN